MKPRTPLWVTIIIIVAALPLVLTPLMLTATGADSPARTLAWFFPAYLIVSAVCAHICYPQRRETAWILIILMFLSDAAMWLLTYGQ
jgi:hypothetical protein